jgi:glycosyltransferase involved in cell wall biosynthesis
MRPQLSVIIPTHNPNRARLERTLAGLRAQDLATAEWELIVVDNATDDPAYVPSFDITWHTQARVIREERLGLTAARLAGIGASRGPYLVFVDDDNILCPGYLSHVHDVLTQQPQLGIIGGKSLPEFEVEPESWVAEFYGCLALRDFGDEPRISNYQRGTADDQHGRKVYPDFAPIGAGMAMRREAADVYTASINSDGARMALDRTGRSLVSGGDNDIILTVLDAGWEVGYFPQLSLTHLIPAGRVTRDYLARLNRAMMRSWVKVLDLHCIRTWRKIPRWSVIPRKVKAYLTYRAWSGAAAYVRWQGACGQFEGLSELP